MTYPKLRLQMFLNEDKLINLAKVAGTSISQICKKLNKQIDFTADERRKIARHYKMGVKELFKGD